MSNASTPSAPVQRTFLGHPLGLYILFFTEMWERFSYYGMRALLMLYMVNYFKWSQKEASTIYKVYTSFVYVTPILGGYLADRYLGNRTAVILGALLMAVGQFALAIEEFPIFLAALILLIIGNGMFKPNMSTQVGRLYPANDGRLDGAYTIFYMGINLGAFLSPIVCGWLAENTLGGYHTGFTMAGIGMLLALAIYLFGQPFIHEIPTPSTLLSSKEKIASVPSANAPLTEAEAAQAPSALGKLSSLVPTCLLVFGLALLAAAPALWFFKYFDQWNALMLAIAGFCLMLFAYICRNVGGGLRDRVLAILILGVFVMFFWAAFEQAGNVFNLWADKSTNRYLSQAPQTPTLKPVAPKSATPSANEEAEPARQSLIQRYRTMFLPKPQPAGKPQQTWMQWLQESFNPMPTAWFQSINALAIFVIAPFFAWMWLALDRRGWQPSIPMKMFFGLIFMSLSMAVMVGAANRENQSVSVPLQSNKLPDALAVRDGKIGLEKNGHVELFYAGRIAYNAGSNTLHVFGVLPDNEANLLIESTAPKAYGEIVEKLKQESSTIDGDKVKSVEVHLATVPPGFDMTWAGLDSSVVRYEEKNQTLTAKKPLADKEVKALLTAGGEPHFRASMEEAYVASNQFRVSPWWLFWTYIFATLGELCLSPVGLSMVSKLAPAKFATMLMGVWMLTSAFGNFIAGALGEIWGTIPPIQFFLLSTAVVAAAALVLLVLVRLVVRTMHGIK